MVHLFRRRPRRGTATGDVRPTLDPGSSEAPIPTPTAALDPSAVRLGRRVHELRLARGHTLVQLATVAGLSHSFLSQLERGLARPSMTSLERIARALGSSQVELLAGTGDGPASTGAARRDASPAADDVLRADEGEWGRYGDGTARLLVTGDRRLSPMEFLGENPDYGDSFVHAEDEFLTVLAGGLVVDLGGLEHELTPGDALYCCGGTPHRWRSSSGAPYRLFLVKESPRRP